MESLFCPCYSFHRIVVSLRLFSHSAQHCHSQIMNITSSIRKSASSPSVNKIAAGSNAFQEDPFLSGQFDRDDGFFDSGFDNDAWGFDFAGVKDNFRDQDSSDTTSGSSSRSGQFTHDTQTSGKLEVPKEKNAEGRSGDSTTTRGRKPTESPFVTTSEEATRASSSSARLRQNSRDSHPKSTLPSRESTQKTSKASSSRGTHDASIEHDQPGRAADHSEPVGVTRRSRTPTQGSRREVRNNSTKNSSKVDSRNAGPSLNTSTHSAPAGVSRRHRHNAHHEKSEAGLMPSRGREEEPMDMGFQRRTNRSVPPKKKKSSLKVCAEEKPDRRSSIAIGEAARLTNGPTESFDERRHRYKMTDNRGKSPHRSKPARESQESPFQGKFQRRRSISNAAAAPVDISTIQPPPGMFPRRNSISNGEFAALQTFAMEKLCSNDHKSRNVTLLERQITPLTSEKLNLTTTRHGQRTETRRSGAARPGRAEPLTHHHDSISANNVDKPRRGSHAPGQSATGHHHDRGRTPPHRRSTAESRRVNRLARNVQSEARATDDSD